MTDPHPVLVRAMRPEERATVLRVAHRSFGLLARLFISLTPHVLVAEDDGRLVGGIVLKVFPLPRGRRGGGVMWVFTDPDARGGGIGQALVDRALGYLEEQGCSEVLACVEGYNASSNKLWATRGFGILSPGAQLRRYGWGIARVWLSMFHLLDIGHFLWARPAPAAPDSPALQWWGTAILNTGLAALVMLRWGEAPRLLALFVGIVLLYGLRTLAMRVAARGIALPLRFRAWDSTYVLATGIALLFGGFAPAPGSIYPQDANWRYRERRAPLGIMAAAGILALMVPAWALRFAAASPALADAAWPQQLLFLARQAVLIDTALPFFPFEAYDGRRVWLWSKPAWALLAVSALALYLL